MKILMICEFYDEDLEYQENLLAKCYARAGHEVVVIASTIRSLRDYYNDQDRGKGPRTEEQTAYAKVIRLPFAWNILHRIKIFTPIREIIEALKPDLLYFHDIIPNILEGVDYVKRNPECAMIMDYHADISNSGANWASRRILHGLVRKYYLDRARPWLKKIYPVVPAGSDFLEQYYGVGRDEMELLPLGANMENARAAMASDARPRVRARLGIADSDLVIFTGGKLTPLKRTEDLLIAVRDLDNPSVHVIIVGTADPSQPDYAAKIDALSLNSPNVHRVGWQDSEGMHDHMAAADLAVFPASQSVLWQQSLSMGLPLILSEQSEALRGVQDVGYLNRHDNLIILDPDTPLPGQLKRHISELDRDRDRLATMSRGALATANEILDYAAIADRTLAWVRQSRRVAN
jgi:1,2-diacylglycerol 3-alpha-glucosyltransferase